MNALRIGEVAERLGVTTRTLRYWEQLGLATPGERSPGGERRYTSDDLARLQGIRSLQEALGIDLDTIAAVLNAEDRLEEIRTRWRADGLEAAEMDALLDEASSINERLRKQVAERLGALESLMADLDARAARHAEVRAQLAAGTYQRPAPTELAGQSG